MRRFSFLLLLIPLCASAQTQHTIFPGQSGTVLLDNLLDEYKPSSLLSESATKDVIMDEIYRVDNEGTQGVFGVYTMEFVPFDGKPSSDPNQDIFNNGAGLNQEHVWPRSELGGGAAVPSERDMHHLVPTGVEVNADRANFPFAEIPDNLTTTWYRFDQEQSTIPDASIIDEFSELRAGTSFEPREDFEGNVARMMFYVATMYPDEANLAFFSQTQRETLYDWHYADPVDQLEYDRTYLIANHQSDSPNPFVLDSTLIRRAFFPEIVVGVPPELSESTLQLDIHPNPSRGLTTFSLFVSERSPVTLTLFDPLGREVRVLYSGTAGGQGRVEVIADLTLPSGVYLVRAETERASETRRLVVTN